MKRSVSSTQLLRVCCQRKKRGNGNTGKMKTTAGGYTFLCTEKFVYSRFCICGGERAVSGGAVR